MTEEETESLQPLYDPKAARWFLGRLSAPTLRQLALKLPEGTIIPDYYPMGYAAQRDGVPMGRAELRTQYAKPHFRISREGVTPNSASSIRLRARSEQPRRLPADKTMPRSSVAGAPKLERVTPLLSLYKTTWSEYEMLKLREMADGGSSAQEIANATGRSRNAVIGQCHRCGVKLKMVYDRKRNK